MAMAATGTNISHDVNSGDTASNSSAAASWTSPGAGITGGYDGHTVTLKIFVSLFCGIAIYNSVELIFCIFMTFQKRAGVYFWSLLLASIGIIPYSLGFLLKYLLITQGNSRWLAVTLLTIGWYPMITGQSLVLWSRLHLIVHGEKGDKIISRTKWMIIIDAICLHIPTTVLTFGANGTVETQTFERGYNIMEKIQMIGFFLQEMVLSGIYLLYTVRILKQSLQPRTRQTMNQLIGINVIIIVLDLALLGLECASLYILETLLKGVIYSIKLKLEFAILGKLVKFVGGTKPKADSPLEDPRRTSIQFMSTDKGEDEKPKKRSKKSKDLNNDTEDVSDFVDLTRVPTDVTHASCTLNSNDTRRRSTRPNQRASELEYDIARFQHMEDVSTLEETDDSERTLEESDESQLSSTTRTADWAKNVV